MAAAPLQSVVRHLRRLVAPNGANGLTDAQLLERIVNGRDEAAFEILVWRHGAMVLDLCRRVLRHAQDAEDAFQATFLVLFRKAGSIGKREAIGSWLYKVAYRVALGARENAVKRMRRERPFVDAAAAIERDTVWRDLSPLLDEEVNRLPEKYRVPFILCYLEGKTVEEAAQQLGCPRGTVGTWLARGRERLRQRLTRRGVMLTATALTAAQASIASASVSTRLVGATLRAALSFSSGSSVAAGVVSAEVFALTEGVLHAMFVTKLKFALGFVLTAALAVGAGGVSCWTYAAEQDKALPVAEVRAINDENPKSELRVERSSVKGWGSTIDPDNDCKFTFEKGKLTITVPGKDHDLGIERKRMNAPRVLQEIEGDFIIQVKVSGTFKPVDADTDDRAAFQGAGLLILEDDNTYLRLERACYIRDGETHHYTIWELRKNSAIEEFGSPADYPLEDGKDYFLRIERHGDKLLGATSQDGERWNYVAPRNVGFGKKLKVGVAAVNTSKQEFAPQFAEFKLFREVGK